MTQLIDLGKLRFHFAGDWSQSTTYETNDIVKYGGNVYVYTYALKTSGQVPTNSTYWALMVEGFKFKGVYDPTVAYRIGDGVAHGGKVYVCVLDNTNQTPPNDTYWSQFADGIQYEGTYSAVKAYQKNDVVVYGGSIYIAKVDTTGNPPTSATYWDRFVEGVSAKGVYNSSTAYVPGDLVAYGGSLYQAKADNTNVNPTTTATWNKLVSGFANRGVWTTATQYATDEVVTFGGNTYIALLPHASTVFETDLTASKWQKFNGGIRWRGLWATATSYQKDDVVRYGASVYIVNTSHTSSVFTTDLSSANIAIFAQGSDFAVPNPALATNGQVVSIQDGAYVFADGKPKVEVISSNTQAKDGYNYMLDSSLGSFTLTLPSVVTSGSRVSVADGTNSLQAYPVTVERNGSLINGMADNLEVNINNIQFTLTYINATTGWKVN